MSVFLEEQFLPIPGYRNYLVSNYGYVLNTITDKELLGTDTKRGGVQIGLSSERGGTRMFYLHRLVARAFLPGFTPKQRVRHKNGNKKDNSITNLELSTITNGRTRRR